MMSSKRKVTKKRNIVARILNYLKKTLGEDYLEEYTTGRNRVFVRTTANHITDTANYMLENDARLAHITTSDLGTYGFDVLYHYALDHIEKNLHIVVKVRTEREKPELPSVTPITWQASFAERESMDLMGMKFLNHPDPRRLFLPYEWPEPVEGGKFDKSQVVGRTDLSKEEIREKTGKWVPLSITPKDAKLTLIPIGPYHPMLIESEYFRLKVNGEEVVDADLKLGFNHRGVMKLAEERTFWRDIYLVERTCGICNATHSTAYCNAVEEIMGVDLPDRARYIRTLILELERLHSHLLWLGVAGDLIGFKTLFMWAWRDREHVLDVFEIITGGRVYHCMNILGGVKHDLKESWYPKIEKAIKIARDATLKYVEMAYDHPILKARTEDLGVMSTATVKEVGAVGPTARGSNWKIDARWSDHHAAYAPEYTSWEPIVESGGDVWARVVVRLKELLVSAELCDQSLDALKRTGGPIKSELDEIPEGEGIGKTEAPRGELYYYVASNGTPVPQTVRIRTPSYRNNACLSFMVKGYTLADAPIIIGSIDPCFSCTDRMVVIEDERTGEIKRDLLGNLAQRLNKKRM